MFAARSSAWLRPSVNAFPLPRRPPWPKPFPSSSPFIRASRSSISPVPTKCSRACQAPSASSPRPPATTSSPMAGSRSPRCAACATFLPARCCACPAASARSRRWAIEEFIAQIQRLAAGARYVTSVCTGSLILGAAGLLKGRRAASHWAWRESLSAFGATPDPARVVRDGVISGGGVTAGIDMALAVVAEIAGEDYAQSVQLGIEYAPAPPFNAGRPETAPAHILAATVKRYDAVRPRATPRCSRRRRAWVSARPAPSATSSASAECVSAPTEMTLTPVCSIARTVCSVTPPEAPVAGRVPV